jgi:hypothetical protein
MYTSRESRTGLDTRIGKISPEGMFRTVAPLSALDIAVRNGNVYFYTPCWPRCPDGGNTVRKIASNGVVSTVAGNGLEGLAGDGGPAVAAALGNVTGLTADAVGNVFITTSGRVRKVTPDGIIHTFAGGIGLSNEVRRTAAAIGDGGPATNANLTSPAGLAVDAFGNLYIADRGNGRIRKVTPEGLITTVAGSDVERYWLSTDEGFIGDGGPATLAVLQDPYDVAVSAAGDLFIAERLGNRIRRVTPDGIIHTVAGTGEYAFRGDGGPALLAHIWGPLGVEVDSQGNVYTLDSMRRIRKVVFSESLPASYYIKDRRIRLFQPSIPPTAGAATLGYARVQPEPGSEAPGGQAIIANRSGEVLVSEMSVPLSEPTLRGRIFVEIGDGLDTGIAIANPHDEAVQIVFELVSTAGASLPAASVTLPPKTQIARFFSEQPFNTPGPFTGAMTLSASLPIGITALRGRTNERGEFLMAALPVSPLARSSEPSVVIPHFAAGGGWVTDIVLVNPTDTRISGRIQPLGKSGEPLRLTIDGQANTSFGYQIEPRAARRFRATEAGVITLSGSVWITADAGNDAPFAQLIFAYKSNGITVTETSVAATPKSSATRIYAETSEGLRAGLAVANPADVAVEVIVDVTHLGISTSPAGTQLTIPAKGQRSVFLDEIIRNTRPLQGLIRVSVPSGQGVHVAGLRRRINERGESLISTMAQVDETGAQTTGERILPHFVQGGSYSTTIVLFPPAGWFTVGHLSFWTASGSQVRAQPN